MDYRYWWVLICIDESWWSPISVGIRWNPLDPGPDPDRGRRAGDRPAPKPADGGRRRRPRGGTRQIWWFCVVFTCFFTWLFWGFCQLKMAISHDFASWFECSDPGGPNGRRSAQVTCLETCALNLEFVAETVTAAELPRIDKSDKIRQIRDT